MIIEIILIVVILAIVGFGFYERNLMLKDFNTEKKQMLENFQTQIRETVLALKTQNSYEYNDAIPDVGESAPLPEDESDSLVELDEVEPKQLLKALSEEKNENK